MNKELNKILLAEDEPDISTVAELALSDVGGLEVKLCVNGQELLDSVDAYNPDLIILDVMMPKLDGPSTLQALRESAKYNNIPVIFMTAKVQRKEIDRYLELGAIGVISKPFDPMSLAEEVKRIWDDKDNG